MFLIVLAIVVIVTLPIGLPPSAANRETPPVSQGPILEDARADLADPKDGRDAREEAKRKQDLTKMLLLWFLRNHPLQ
jgi:hypothetical protein